MTEASLAQSKAARGVGAKPGDRRAAAACAGAGFLLFQFWGNSTRGYIDTASLFRWWWHQWVNPDSETQHGLLIAALSAWLFWRNWRRAGHAGPGAHGAGVVRVGARPLALAAMLGGLALHTAGFVAEQARISVLGLLMFGFGVLSLGYGRRASRAAAFPTAFLVFAIPLSALDSTGFWLRMWVVDSGAALAHAVGIGVVKNGTQLLAPDGRYDYDVAAACSGVRSLVALSALSLLVGYLRFRPAWLRAGFFLASFPLVYAGNVARIFAIIVAAQAGGQAWGDRVHAIMGFGVFAIVLGGVLAAAEGIERLRPRWSAESEREPSPQPSSREGILGAGAGFIAARWAAALIVVASFADAAFLARMARRAPAGRAGVVLAPDGLSPATLPTFAGSDWMGHAAEVTAVERDILPPDTGFSRKTYLQLSDPRRQVFVSIVLSGRDRTSIHRPELCLVGQGWTIDGSFVHPFADPRGAGFQATVLRVRRETATAAGRVQVPELVSYWFVGGDTIVATHLERVVRDAWLRVAHGRSDRWAYVLLQTGAADGESAALGRMQTILTDILPAFQQPAAPSRPN